MTRIKYILLVIINTIGVIVSLYSLFLTERLNNFILDSHLICDINKTISCSTTYLSGYAFFSNIPVSLFAVLFFWFVLSCLLLNSKKEIDTGSYQLLGIVNTVALLICAYFLYVLIIVLRNICISCILIDTIVFLNFILLFKYTKSTFITPKLVFKKLLIKNWLILLSFVLLFVVGLVLYETYLKIINNKNRVLLEAFYKKKPEKDIPINNPIIWGCKNGKVEIRIFNDFLCNYCKIVSERYREIFRKDSAAVKIEFICYPLDYENSKKQGSSNINIFLSKIMLAASQDKAFWSFHDLIIAQSNNLDSVKIFGLAAKYLNDFEAFRDVFFTKDFDSILIGNIKLAHEYKVTGTPTIFINGREFQQWMNINILKMIVSTDLIIKP